MNIQKLISGQMEEILSLVRNPYLTSNDGRDEVEDSERRDENLEDRKKIARKLKHSLTTTVQAVLDDIKENGVVEQPEMAKMIDVNCYIARYEQIRSDRKYTLDHIDKLLEEVNKET